MIDPFFNRIASVAGGSALLSSGLASTLKIEDPKELDRNRRLTMQPLNIHLRIN
jgi:hypothetical protein